MKFPKFIIKKSVNDQYYFNLWSINEEIVLKSEMYTTKQNCKNGIDSVKVNSQDERNYEKKVSTDAKYYFILKSAHNNQIIGVSRFYDSATSRDSAISVVKRDARVAETEDLS